MRDLDLSLFDEPGLPNLAGLVSRAWPGGLSAEDADAIARLSRASHRKLRLRLAAMLDLTQPSDGRSPPVTELADAADLKPSQFHLLASRWRSGRRSVAALGLRPPGGRRTRGTASADVAESAAKVDRSRLDEAVLEILASNPRSTVKAVKGLLPTELMRGLAPLTLRRAVESARRNVPSECFGGRIVLDSAGLDLVDEFGERLRLFAVVDQDSLIALSWIIATENSKSMGFVWAATMFGDALPEGLANIAPCKGAPTLEIRFDPRDEEGRRLFEEALPLTPPPRSTYARIPGKAVLEALGERLDRIWLGTGSRDPGVGFRTGRKEHLPEITAPIHVGIEAAIAAHNRRRVDLMTRPGVIEGVGAARVAEIYGLMAAVSDLFDRVMALPFYVPVPGDLGWEDLSSRTTS